MKNLRQRMQAEIWTTQQALNELEAKQVEWKNPKIQEEIEYVKDQIELLKEDLEQVE